jgi:hypothetical protein
VAHRFAFRSQVLDRDQAISNASKLGVPCLRQFNYVELQLSVNDSAPPLLKITGHRVFLATRATRRAIRRRPAGRTKLTVHILAAITQYERELAKAAAACCLMRLSFASQNRLCRLPSASVPDAFAKILQSEAKQ